MFERKIGNTTFRFTQTDLDCLDWLIEWFDSQQQRPAWGPRANRTNVIRTLIYEAKEKFEQQGKKEIVARAKTKKRKVVKA